jgi:hypothetical protein
MLHIGAQPGPPEVELELAVDVAPGPPEVAVEVEVTPGPPDVAVDVTPGPPELEVVPVRFPLVVLTEVLPPPPPAPAPCSLLPDAHAAMSAALESAMRTKVVLACFTGVW